MATQVEVDEKGNEYPIRVTGQDLADYVVEAVTSGIKKINELNGEDIHGNLSDKLDKLIETKETIMGAIENSGVPIPEGTPFAQYPQYIFEILNVVTGSLLMDANYYADALLNILEVEEIGGQG